MAWEVERAQGLFEQGLPLVETLEGTARLHVKLFSLGGMRVLDAIRAQDYDVLSKRPVVSGRRKAWLLAKTYLGMKLTRQDLAGVNEVERGMVQATVLEEAYAHCQRVTKAEAKNFYYAFVTLPKAKRQAIYAVYAFCRLCDDIADEPLPVDEKRRKLREVDVALEHARDGNPDGPVYSALAHAVREYGIPWEDLSEVARGVEMDLTLSRYETFEDLATYCYRVASVVGIICIHIFGFTDPVAREYAVDLGLGMQLTNILRDIKEDAEMDRVYLPQEELRRFGYPEEALMAGETSDEFTRLMRFQVARARGYFDSGKRLLPLLPVRSRACPAVLGGLYSRVLDRIEQRDYDVFERRVSLQTREKLFLAVRLWLQSYVPLKGVAAAW